MKNLLKNYRFWISFVAFTILITQIIAKCFNIQINIPLISEILTSICAFLIFWGIITIPNSNKKSIQEIQTKVKQDVKEKVDSYSKLLEDSLNQKEK